ncbi:MAG TPA: M20 aminoacylase family protein [Devosiaceae bacterium]
MPVINRIAEFQDDIVAWRRDFHANPELLYDVERTAERVAGLLRSFGVDEVVTGIGRTGVVGLIRGGGGSTQRVIGLRADMDALPILERTGKPYASQVPGKMHACGHDGHTAMLLGAARYLAETRQFEGTVALIFQPAEEGGGGGKAMLDDGLVERFGLTEVYGLHNWPGLPEGQFGIREGAIMAGADQFAIEIEGVGAHAAMPHLSIDPVMIAAQMVNALQTIASRNINPLHAAVVSVTTLQAGDAHNVIPRTARLTGTVRMLDETVRGQIEARLREVVEGTARTFGAKVNIDYMPGYPVTVNAPEQAEFATQVAIDVAGADRVVRNVPPSMGSEDFSYMLQALPGAYIFLGQGNTAGLHQDTYDFNDAIIPAGTSYWVRLVETALPARRA